MVEGDLDLLRAWRLGDRRAGNLLFNRYFKSVLRFFRSKIDDNVEELVQRTFMACVEGRDRFRQASSFRTYLFAVANNVLRAYFREKLRDARTLEFDTLSAVDLGASPSSLVDARREQRLLLEGLRQIPLNSQVILELFYWEQLPGSELATILGIPENTARSRLRRARKYLERVLRDLARSQRELESTVSNLEGWAMEIRALLEKDPPSEG